jgi:hypothetical protein
MARPTRGGSTKKKAPIKKRTPKKKSVDKVRAEDDSDLELNSDGEVKEKKERKGGFHKQYYLSAPLAELVGETTVCSRSDFLLANWNANYLYPALATASRQEDLGVYQRAELASPRG